MAYGEEEGPLGPVSSYGSVSDQEWVQSENEWKIYQEEQGNGGSISRRRSLMGRFEWWCLKFILLPLFLAGWTAETVLVGPALTGNDLTLFLICWASYLALIVQAVFRRRARSTGNE